MCRQCRRPTRSPRLRRRASLQSSPRSPRSRSWTRRRCVRRHRTVRARRCLQRTRPSRSPPRRRSRGGRRRARMPAAVRVRLVAIAGAVVAACRLAMPWCTPARQLMLPRQVARAHTVRSALRSRRRVRRRSSRRRCRCLRRTPSAHTPSWQSSPPWQRAPRADAAAASSRCLSRHRSGRGRRTSRLGSASRQTQSACAAAGRATRAPASQGAQPSAVDVRLVCVLRLVVTVGAAQRAPSQTPLAQSPATPGRPVRAGRAVSPQSTSASSPF